MRRHAHAWVVEFGNVNDLKMVSPTDGAAIIAHLSDKLRRLATLQAQPV